MRLLQTLALILMPTLILNCGQQVEEESMRSKKVTQKSADGEKSDGTDSDPDGGGLPAGTFGNLTVTWDLPAEEVDQFAVFAQIGADLVQVASIGWSNMLVNDQVSTYVINLDNVAVMKNHTGNTLCLNMVAIKDAVHSEHSALDCLDL